jgi:hypothetical protein
VGERFERSVAGRVLLTVAMAVLAVAVLLWNLPSGPAGDRVQPLAGRVLLPLGLDQDWSLFAPDPRGFSVGVHARLTYADGSERVLQLPERGRVLGPYRTYRWQKFAERVRADDYEPLWEPTARWFAEHGGEGVTRVELVRTFRDSVVPGSGTPRPGGREFAFFTWEPS